MLVGAGVGVGVLVGGGVGVGVLVGAGVGVGVLVGAGVGVGVLVGAGVGVGVLVGEGVGVGVLVGEGVAVGWSTEGSPIVAGGVVELQAATTHASPTSRATNGSHLSCQRLTPTFPPSK